MRVKDLEITKVLRLKVRVSGFPEVQGAWGCLGIGVGVFVQGLTVFGDHAWGLRL